MNVFLNRNMDKAESYLVIKTNKQTEDMKRSIGSKTITRYFQIGYWLFLRSIRLLTIE